LRGEKRGERIFFLFDEACPAHSCGIRAGGSFEEKGQTSSLSFGRKQKLSSGGGRWQKGEKKRVSLIIYRGKEGEVISFGAGEKKLPL